MTLIKALKKSCNFVLITPFHVNYNLIYECFRNCMFAKNYAFLHFHRAISKKLQHKIMKICSFSYLLWYFKSTKYE
jgi:hypothetical protein